MPSTYITGLPKAVRDAADWQIAMETLLLVAERKRAGNAGAHRGHEGAEPAPAEGSASAAAKPGQGLSDRPVIEAVRI